MYPKLYSVTFQSSYSTITLSGNCLQEKNMFREICPFYTLTHMHTHNFELELVSRIQIIHHENHQISHFMIYEVQRTQLNL